MDWAQVLVIILSLLLGVFLLVAITLVVMLIRVTRQIHQVTTTAQHAVSAFGQIANRAHIAKVSAFATRHISKMTAKLRNNKRT